MRKIFCLINALILVISMSACAGYKPIFSSSNLSFKIANYNMEDNRKLGNIIYSKFYQLSESSKNDPAAKIIDLLIGVKKSKNATTKNSAGKILEYRINIDTKIVVKDFLTNDEVINQTFSSSASFRVQDQHSETIALENKNIENLINLSFHEFLIKFNDKMRTE